MNAVKEWLEKRVGQTIMIRKEEQDDLDETRLHLEHVEYNAHVPTVDDYTEGNSLILHGPGKVVREQGDIVLPQNTFQIYIDGLSESRAEEEQLSMKTDRAKYLIFVIH
jgi:hypothetical protein